MSCSAKIPLYGFFVAAFFPGKGGLIMTGLYFLGIVLAILVALVMKRTIFKGEAVPFVMELPNYRMPSPKNVGQLLWEKSKDFIQKAFSVILIATLVVWFLQSFDVHFNFVTDSSTSMMALVSGAIAPIFRPLDMGDWRIVTSLISGFMAKESLVSTMQILFGSSVATAISPITAATMLVFCLLYTTWGCGFPVCHCLGGCLYRSCGLPGSRYISKCKTAPTLASAGVEAVCGMKRIKTGFDHCTQK